MAGRKAPKPCRSCKRATANSNGYCDSHQQDAVGWRKTQQGRTTTQRGYGWKWAKIRRRILDRDEYLCVPCRARGIYMPAVAVDHIVNKAVGGTDDDANLQAICKPCHQLKTQNEQREGRVESSQAKAK